MKPQLTLFALLAAGLIHLHAQEPTANEAAWSALLADKKSEAAASPEAIPIKDSILAGDAITRIEANAIALVIQAQGGDDAYRTTFRSLAQSSKSGEGVSMIRAIVKHWDGETTGWTEEMLAIRPDLGAALANRKNAAPEFKEQVWSVLKDVSAHAYHSRIFFKAYRSALPKAQQIEVSRKQKDLVLAIPTRGPDANAWLAEISADLVALQLDQ